ncbi:MAG: VPLPA-CTERM sorting domain-containing protein [Desulfosarcina sp.]|nr:VPLPA-CTERM sorting domain-containing protein [Desulfobacterales bacterium]
MLSIKKLLQTFILLPIIGLATGPAMGANFSLVILNVDPLAQNHFVGDEFSVGLMVSGLEFEDIGAFDMDLSYDDSILSFNNYNMSDELGAVGLDALDISWGDSGGGLIYLSELSLLSDLSFQSDEFSLATLSFTGMDVGISELSISNYTLGDVVGDPLGVLAAIPGFVQINPVPIPATALLLGSGIIGMVGLRRRSRP